MNKSDLLNRLRERAGQWQTLLDQIGLARMDQPGVNGNWSMKDMVAHLTGWNRWLVARLLAARDEVREPRPSWPAQLSSEDDINAWIYAANHDRPAGEVLADMQQVFQELLAVLTSLPDEIRIERVEPAYDLVWVNDQRFLVGEFFDHFYDDHERDVRAWLAREENR